MRTPVVRLACLVPVLATCLALAACASDEDKSSSGGDGGADAGRDARGGGATGESDADGDDSQATPDQGGTPDAGSDPVEEVIEPVCGAADQACCSDRTCHNGLDCVGSVCTDVQSQCPGIPACLVPQNGPTGVPVIMRSGDPPELQGGEVESGVLELDQIEVYGDYTFSDLVDSVDVTSQGGTAGGLEFLGPDWGFTADLDLYIDIVAINMDFGQPFQQVLAAGGCYTVEGGELASDLSECGASWPEGSEPPDSLAFETTATGMKFLLILTKEALLASVPPADAFAAQLAITGDLPVVFTFTRVE